jgi:hypothetical protein
MYKVFKQRDGKLLFRQAAASLILGWFCLLFGLAFSAALVAGHRQVARKLADDPTGAVFLLFPVGCIVGGLSMIQASRWQVVDPQRKQLRIGERMIPLDDAQAVLLSTETRVARSGGHQVEFQAWELGLVMGTASRMTRATLRCAAEWVKSRQDVPRSLSNRPWKTVQRRLIECREDLRANRLPLVTNAHEGQAWRAAKRLSQALNLPIVDDAGDAPVLLTQGLVHGTLVDRLKSIGGEPIGPAVLPGGAAVRQSSGRLTIEYRHQRWVPILVVLLVAGVFAAAIAILGGIFLLPVFLLLALLPAAGRGHGRNTLEIDTEQVRYTSRFLVTCTSVFPLAELEHIRADRMQHPAIHLMSEQRILRCHMPGELVGPVRGLLLQFLAGLPLALVR